MNFGGFATPERNIIFDINAHDHDRAIKKIKRETRSLVASAADRRAGCG
jgi:hypothetical protein